MKALRILLIVCGCFCIAANLWIMASSNTSKMPIDASLFEMLGLYVSKMFLLIGGILLLVFASNIHPKHKHLA